MDPFNALIPLSYTTPYKPRPNGFYSEGFDSEIPTFSQDPISRIGSEALHTPGTIPSDSPLPIFSPRTSRNSSLLKSVSFSISPDLIEDTPLPILTDLPQTNPLLRSPKAIKSSPKAVKKLKTMRSPTKSGLNIMPKSAAIKIKSKTARYFTINSQASRLLQSLQKDDHVNESNFFLKNEAPTKVFLDSLTKEQTDYISHYTKILPVDTIIENEAKHLNTHFPLYTAFNTDINLVQLISSEFIKMRCGDEDPFSKTRWLRSPFSDPPGKHPRLDSITAFREYLEVIGQKNPSDQTKSIQWFLVSCNPHLFGNTLIDSQESTVDYYFSNQSVQPPDISNLVKKLFTDFNLFKHQPDELENVVNEIKKIRTEFFGGEGERHGILLQIFIPKDEIQNFAYISKPVGYPDENHPDINLSLLNLQTKDEISNKDSHSMQARLYIPRMLDPEFNEDCMTYSFSDLTKEKELELEERIQNLICESIKKTI